MRRKRVTLPDPKLDMSSMIDVVFLLLIFFIVTVTADDMLASLEIARPTTPPPPISPIQPEFSIEVLEDGYSINKARHSLDYIEQCLIRLIRYSDKQQIIIICHDDSQHERLVKLLDLCSKHEIKNLALMSR